MSSQKEEIWDASGEDGNEMEDKGKNITNGNENQEEDQRVIEEEDDKQENGRDEDSKNESNSQSDQGRMDRENEDDEEEDGQSSNQHISSQGMDSELQTEQQGESNQGSRQEDGGMESGSGGRRVSSRKRNKKQISDMDFSYKPKVAGSLPAVKKNKKDQKASVGTKHKKIEVIEPPPVVISAAELAKEREEKKKQEKLLRKEAERLEKIQKQLEREEKEKQRKAEKLLKEQLLLEEQQLKREKKEQQQQLSVVKKNVNKRIFNPQEYNQAVTKKIQLETELREIFINFGAKQDKYPEPEQANSRWEYVLQEIQDTAEYFQKRRSYFQFQTKKIAKHSLTALANLKQSKEQKVKEEAKRIRKIAETCNQMVQRFFWRGMHRVKKFMKVMEFQQEQKEDQQKRLESLVSDQLNLSSKLAKLLQIAKEIPELDTQKAVEESKAKSIASEKTEEEKIQEEQLRIEKATAAAEKEAEKRRKKEEELEQEIIENEELAEKYDISIELSRDNNNNYLFSKMLYTKKPNEYGELDEDIDIEEDQEIEDELEQDYFSAYGNIKLPFHDFEPQVVSLNDQTIVQPFLLKGRLREYQLIGQNWLATLQQKKMNGILADEMGLGKTIQTIAMLAHLACNKGVWGPHLIIVPTSILINWEIEFKKWCPAFKIMTYYGSPKERKLKRAGWSKMNHFHVCITSYKMALQDQKIFRRKKWYFMVLDEAQHIKNFKSQRWQVLLNFHTKHRLLLTGTPLQNDVGELWSLLHFLMPRIFDSHADFMEWFSIPMQQALQKNLPISQEILTKLHSILRPFLLRRLKRDVERQLPTKTEYIVKCTLSRRQKYLYDEFISRDDTKKSMHQQDFLGLMNIVMQLKKVCNHPDLFEARTIESPFQSAQLRIVVFSHFLLSTKCHIPQKLLFIYNEMSTSAYELAKAKTLMPIADDFYEMNNLLLSQENWPEFIPHYAQRWKILSQFNKQQSLKRTYKTNRQRILSENVIYGADTIQFLTFQQKSNPYQELSEFQTLTFEQTLDSVRMLIKEFSFSQRAIAEPPQMIITPFDSEKSNYYRRFNQEAQKPLNFLARQFHYCNIRRILCFPSKKLLMYDCGKLNTMIQLLKKLKSRGDKVLIFTQMSRMLDIFENVLNLFNFTYVRLDGSTKIENRQKVVERFNGDPRIFCFISSTRSGGIGLNLTGANVVLFYDTDWNPAMDRQAQDRCHRIGQTRNVSIYRLISEYTIEENILLKSIQKRKLDEYIMEEGKFNTQFYEKFDVRGILGGMLGESKKQIEEEKLDKQQIEKVLENVEDKEDAVALKKAQMEEIEFVTEGAAEVADMDKDEEAQKEKAFSVDTSKFPKIFQYCIRFIKNEEELHLNDGEKDMEDEDDMSEDEEEDNENDIEDGSKQKIVVEEEDEEFKYVSEDKRDDEDEEDEKNKKQIDNQEDNEEGNNSNDENIENNSGQKNKTDENNGLIKQNENEVKEEQIGNGNNYKSNKDDQDIGTTNINDENLMQDEDQQAAPQSNIDKEDDEDDIAGLKKNGLFSTVLMEEDRGGEEGRRLTRTALRKSAKVQARKQLDDMLQRIQEEQEKEEANNGNNQNGMNNNSAKNTPGKPKKKVTFLDEVLLQQQQAEKQQKDQLKKAKQQQQGKISQGSGVDLQGEQLNKSTKQEDGEEDEMNIEQEDIDEEEEQDQEQDQELEDIEEEDKFNDEDRRNSIKIYKKHFLFVKKNYFV